MIGTRVAHYELNERLGAGGMGEVYRARDTKLGRDVALKVLPESFANDAERAARFEREAKVLAALNHPNIASIYGFEGGALIMELVEGESPRGPIPVENVRHIASQIAAGLEYAHDKGIIHRDLKPANIKITTDGVVKLLDFGLAKAFSEPGSASTEDLSNSPTVSMATQVGVILGTAAYMAPEQAKGKNVDKRADIWAFGVVLFELLTGRQLFEGDDASEILAQVLTKVPDWEQAPGSVQPLLRACLEKDPRKRLRDIGDANRLWMEAKPEAPVGKTHRAWKVAAAVAAALLLPAAIVSFFHLRETPPRVPVVISTLLPPENTTFDFVANNGSGLFALSPDGTKIVMTARGTGNTQLWLQSLDSLTARPLPGTEGATYPFWAPDSRNLGFFADQKLKRIDTSGGPPVPICDAMAGRGGTWSRDNIIVFAPSNNEPLQSISLAGGPAKAVTTYLPDDGPQRLPWFLPDGQHFLYRVQSNKKTAIRIGSLKDMNYKVVGPGNSNAIYSKGYLLFRREGTLMAQAFDPEKLATTGDAVPIAENVNVSTAAGFFSASETGLLVYQKRSADLTSDGYFTLAWTDRNGKELAKSPDPGDIGDIAISPDQKKFAYMLRSGESAEDIWIYDIGQQRKWKFTIDSGIERIPIWSPDSAHIIFNSNKSGFYDIYRKPVDFVGTEEVLWASKGSKVPTSVSSDGKFLLVNSYSGTGKGGVHIWTLPLLPEQPGTALKPHAFLDTGSYDENDGQFSPKGNWVAYTSTRSGRSEVYVTRFPDAGWQRLVSSDGGEKPRWNPNGNGIFYMEGSTLKEVEVVNKGATLEIGQTRTVIGGLINSRGYLYDVGKDGRLLVKTLTSHAKENTRPQPAPQPITLVTNWPGLLP